MLFRSIAVQDETSREVRSDGAAIDQLLNVAGWAADKRVIDYSGGDITRYPTTVEY